MASAASAQTLKGDWPMINFDAKGQRYNPYETVLSKKTVSSLQLAWHLDNLNDTSYSQQVSSPVVAGGLLYVGSRDGHFYARNAVTGKKLWTVKLGTWVAYAPAVANGIVYVPVVTSQRGKLAALDAATGTTLWTVNFKDGIAGSPAIANGRVFQSAGGTNPLYAFDARTGKQLWKTGIYGGCWGAPAIANGIVYSLSNYALSAFSAATGAKLWEQNALVGGSDVGSAAVAGDKVYGDNTGATAAFDAATGALAWNMAAGPNSTPGIAVAKDRVYSLDTAGIIWNYDATSGATSFLSGEIGLHASPAFANGILYAGSHDAIGAYDVNSGAVLWSAPLTAGVQGSPLIANGMLYVLSGGSLYAYGLKN